MLFTEHDKDKLEIRKLVDLHGADRGALLEILQKMQKRHRYLSEDAMQVIADMLNIYPVEVYSVVSFYGFLHDKPRGRFVIRLCRTISCEMQGKDAAMRQLKNDLGIDFGETTSDGMFTLEWGNCMGMCDQGPAMMINNKLYSQLTPQKVHDVLEECRQSYHSGSLEKESSEEHMR